MNYHDSGYVTYSGVVKDEATRASIIDAIKGVCGAGNAKGDITLDPTRRGSAVALPDLKAALESSKIPVLQADCFAGVWANHSQQKWKFLEPGDVEAALQTASAIGDDRLQRRSQGYVVPDAFTHGSSRQRVRWFWHRAQVRGDRKLRHVQCPATLRRITGGSWLRIARLRSMRQQPQTE